jgi:mannose-6-phosphate isomerase-like protein (cupin superfamily)
VPKPRFTPLADARVLPLFGGDLRITMPADAPGAGFSAFEDVRQPGDGPPWHMHHGEEELFRVVSGRFRMRCGDQEFEAGPGDTALLPRGVPHSFVNSGDTVGTMMCVVQPGGFENFFIEIADAGLQIPADMGRILEIAARYRLELLGPNPFSGR